jgi:protein SCO1/2
LRYNVGLTRHENDHPSNTRMSNRLIIVVAAIAAILGVLAGRIVRDPPQPEVQEATVLTPARAIADFSLQRGDGSSFSKASLRGRWTLAFFGFTNCPDVCPATLSLLARVRADVASSLPDPDAIAVIFVSIDPQRDTPAVASDYAAYFDKSFIGLSGADDAIEAIATDLGILRLKIPQDAGQYTMDHTASVLLIDPEARLRAVFSPPLRPAPMAADLLEIIDAA